jgi:hypothetical protein
MTLTVSAFCSGLVLTVATEETSQILKEYSGCNSREMKDSEGVQWM